MKKFFKMSALALFGGLLALTSCADYRSDINDLNDRLDALETGKIADLESQIKSLSDALGKAQSAIDALEALGIEDLKDQLEDLQATVDGIDLSKYATLDYVNGTFATKDYVEELNTKLGALEGRVKDLEGLYDTDIKISEILDKIDDAQADASSALGQIKALQDALGVYAEAGALQDALDLKMNIADFNDAFNEALKAALEDGGMISTEIAKAINEAVAKLEALFAKRITSVSLIPELYVDGTPTIPFYTIAYWAQNLKTTAGDATTIGNEYSYDVPNIDWRNVSLRNTVARYHVSPDGLAKSDIGTPEYLIEEVYDLKSGDNEFFSIDSYDFVDGEFQVQLKKNTTDGYVIHSPSYYIVHTAALKIPIAEKHLVEGEESAAVYSEYSKIAEVSTSVNIASLYNLANNQTSGEYECNIRNDKGQIVGEQHYHFYNSFIGATEVLPAKRALYSENLDLNTMVTGCLLYGYNYEDVDDEYQNTWCKEITKEELNALGFEFRFYVPEVKYPQGANNTDQQQFGQIVDGHYLQPTVPGDHTNNRAAIGRTPVVRVELVDTNNDDAIVDVQYFRIVWVENEIPTTVIEEPVRTFEYILSCEDFQGRLTWDEINDLILSQIGPDGISHNMFVDAYRGGNITVTPADGRAANFYNNYDVDIDWDVNPNAPATSVFTWDLDIERIGNVIDDLLAGKEVKFAVTVTVHPNEGAETYAGTQTFTVEMVVVLPELPELVGTTGVNWTIEKELLRVYPVLYGQHDKSISETVYYKQILNQFFNVDESGLFVSNIVPTQEQINAAAKQVKANGEARTLGTEWACRGYDIVFEQNQVGVNGYYSPNYASNNLHQLIDRGSMAVASNLLFATAPWLRTNDLIWLDLETYNDPADEAIYLLNRNRTQDVAKDHYANGVTKREDIAKYGEDFKYVTFDIITRINAYNEYTAHTFDAWFVSPLAIDVTIDENFVDQVIGGSKINVADAFDATKDFNDQKVALTPSTGMPEELRVYYGVEAPVWAPENARISLVNNGGSLVADNTLDANIPAELNKMQKLSDLERNNIYIRVEYVNDELIFYADNGWAVENEVNIWVPVTVTHKWGQETIYAKILLKPAGSTNK